MSRAKIHAVTAALVVILVLSLPGDVLTALQDMVRSILSWESEPQVPSALPTDKLLHVILFAWLAWSSRRAWPASQAQWVLVGYLIVMALLTELIQIAVPGRSADVWDVFADLIGALLGFVSGARLVHPKSPRVENPPGEGKRQRESAE